MSSVSKAVIPKVPGHRTNALSSGRFDRFIAASKTIVVVWKVQKVVYD